MQAPRPKEWNGFPRERTWLLPALDAVQRRSGYVSPDALAGIAEHLRVPLSEVWGVATQYPEIRLTQPGRRLVRVCTGLSCRLRGADGLLADCAARLGLTPGDTAPSGDVTLEAFDCAFACGVAPVAEVDHACVGHATADRIAAMLDGRTTGPSAPERVDPSSRATASPIRSASGTPVERLRALGARRDTGTRFAVGTGTCGASVGAFDVVDALREEITRRGIEARVVAAGCSGACWAAPTVRVLRPGAEPVTLGPVRLTEVPRLLDALDVNDLAPFRIAPAFERGQRRLLLERAGIVDPGDIADAIALGAYAAFANALERSTPERIIEEVRTASLAGRGGAYFPTAIKWAGCRAARGAPKYIVVNAEEGEPGIFKDRHLMEGDPHGLLEGVLLAAHAAGASRAILYVHGEANLSAARLTRAVAQARAVGLVGDRILGTEFSLDIEMRRGLGGFVLGEETALLESIEGRRAMPRTRPPFPVESGLHGRPTVINNVETLCAVPRLLASGATAFAALGRGHGTKLFGLSGHLKRPGLVEVELGVTLRTLIDDIGGGSSTGRPIRAAVVGGPSGSVVHPRNFDEPMVPRGPVNPGTGGVIALDDRASVAEVVRTLLGFNARESCGKCTPCREGTARLLAMLDEPLDAARVKELADVIQAASLCGLGQAAPYAVLSGVAEFPEDFAR
jgi:NADH-quinone oxidoreductase subunit F